MAKGKNGENTTVPGGDPLAASKAALAALGKDAAAVSKQVAEIQKAAAQAIPIMQQQADAMTAVGEAAREAAESTEELAEATQTQVDVAQEAAEVTKQLDVGSQALKSTQEGLVNVIKDGNKATKSSSKSLGDMAKEFAKNSKAVQALVVGFKTFAATLKAIKAVIGGALSVIGTLASAIFEVGAALVALPFQFMEVLIGRAKEAMGAGTELAEAYENVREVFGDISKGTSKDIINIGRSLATGVIAPGLTARQVFGTFAEALNEINKVASATPALFQSLSGQFNESGLQIMAMAKGLGFGEEELAGLQSRAVATGESLVSMEAEVTKYAKGMSSQFGLNSKAMSRDMGRAMKDVKHFANATVKEIAQATTFAHKLGLELKDITGSLDAFNTFDQAAENVAKLSQAFGVNIDVMKLMEANTPAEQLDEIKKAFAAAGKSADQMNRHELQLIASATGYSEEVVRQSLSMKNAGVSMDAVKSSASGLEAQTMSTGQAISSLAADIKRMVKAGQAPEGGSFFEIFLEGFVKGIDLSGDFQKLIKAVMKDMWIVRDAGMAVGRAFVKFFPGVSEFFQGLTEFLNPTKIKGLMSTITGTFIQFFKDLGKGTATVEGLINSLYDNFVKFFKADAGGKKILDGLSKMWTAVERIISTGIDYIADSFKSLLDIIVNFLEGGYDDALSGASGRIGSGVSSMIEKSPITQSLIRAFDNLSGPLEKVFDKLWKKITDKLAEVWANYKWEILTVTLGPTLVSMLFQAIGMTAANPANVAALAKALGPAVGAALGIALAAWQLSEYYDDEKRDFITESKAFAEHEAELSKSTLSALENIKKQNEEIEKRYKLGQSTTEEYNSQLRTLEKHLAFSKKIAGEDYAKRFSSVAKEVTREMQTFTSDGMQLFDSNDEALTIRLNSLGDFISKTSGDSIDAQRFAIKQLTEQVSAIEKEQGLEGNESINRVVEAAKSGKVALSTLSGASIESIKSQFKELDISLNQEEAAVIRLMGMREALDKSLRMRERASIESRKEAALAARAEAENLTGAARAAALGRAIALEADIKIAERKFKPEQPQSAATPTEGEGGSLLDELGIGATFDVEDATEKLKSVEELSKKVLSKDFDLKNTMEKIREKLKDVKFNLFDPKESEAKAKEIQSSTTMIGNIVKIPGLFAALPAAFGEAATALQALGSVSDGNSLLGRYIVGLNKIISFIALPGGLISCLEDLKGHMTVAQPVIDGAAAVLGTVSASTKEVQKHFDAMKGHFEEMAKMPESFNTLIITMNTEFLDNLKALGILFGPTDDDEGQSIASRFRNVQGLSEVNGSVAEWIDGFTLMLGNLDDLAQSSQFTNLTTVAEAFDQAETDLLTIERVMSGFDQTIKDIEAAAKKLSKTDVGQVIKKFYDAMSELNRSLSNVTVGEGGEIRVKLSKIAEGINKASGNFTIQKAPVSVNLTVNVELAVSDVEKTIMKSGRLIRDAFNALADKGGQELSPSGGSFVQKGASG